MKRPNWIDKLERDLYFFPEVIQLKPEVHRGRLYIGRKDQKKDTVLQKKRLIKKTIAYK